MPTIVIGPDHPATVAIVEALEAEHVAAPGATDDWTWEAVGVLDQWREAAGSGPMVSDVVVAMWREPAGRLPLIAIDDAELLARVDGPLAWWVAALGAAVKRCEDGGRLVAVVDRPPPLDAAGWSPESGVADAVEALVKSLARSEGHRGVRVNGVTTPSRLAPADVVAPAPLLPTYPGTIEAEVVEAVRMLCGPGVAGITGTMVHADCGRRWR